MPLLGSSRAMPSEEKSEIRNSKSETIPKFEIQNGFGRWDFGFVSDFEFRISDLHLKAAFYITAERVQPGEPMGGGMRILLAVIAGPHKGLEFSFDKHDTFLVGRSRHAHFQLPAKDKYFSRIHFMIEANPPECRLIDMGSHNGTYVNGEKVLTVDLKDNDQIRAGHTMLRVKMVEGTAAEEKADSISFHPADAAGKPPTIAGYLLERELGRGAMGTTYLAQRIIDGGICAIKVVQPGVQGSKAQIDEFIKSARFLTQLTHPHIVRLLDAGLCPTGFYFVSEYVPGVNAAQLLQRDGPLTLKRSLRIGSQILQALQYAHSKHFVHRDLKPANVLIGEEGGKEIVKLADFGLARTYHATPFGGLSVTAALLNLASFMPPELLFNYQEVNPLADQYAVAALLYHLLTGADVVPQVHQTRYSSLLRRYCVPLSERRKDVPPAVAEVIHKALSRAPSQRFKNVAEFRQALIRAVEEE
jgi:eukaryotic-like serine/threonine-protein kinase